MKKFLLLLLISLPCCARAQNIEGQIVASQFGEFKVQSEGNGFAFDPANCNVSGGGKNFPAFVTGTPVKIVDSNPAQIEIVIPVSASITGSYCTVSLPTQYPHTSFYLTSGTGGLQEAITANQTNNGINSIILNWEWYRLVAPGNPASVIASVTGISSLGLVDITTTPYNYYAWNGTQYVSVGTGGGGSIPTTPLVLKGNNAGAAAPAVPGTDYVLPSGNITGSAGSVAFTGLTGTPTIWNQNTTGTAAGLSAASALPNNTTAATQTAGDTSTKVATDAFVLANVGTTVPATSSVLKGTGSANSVTSAIPGTDYLAPGGAAPGVTPLAFGGYGDAYAPPDGCITAASSTTITCPDGPFVSGDVGKQIWVHGAGAAGVAFHATISSVTSNTAVVASASASTAVSNTPGNAVYGHDDVTAVQACFQYSASHATPCALNPVSSPPGIGNTGFLIGSGGLQLVSNNGDLENSGMSAIGNSQAQGTNIFCEYNGDCLSLAAGPIQGVNVTNIAFEGDPSQPNGRGIHLNAQAGTYGNGGLFQSNFTNINVDNFALECLWMDGGGGTGYSYNLPNQIDTFYQFQCNGPNQSHPANLIKMTGQAAQILFLNGQTNGQGYSGGSSSFYPNPLIAIKEKTSGLSDTPVDVKFYGYTYEVGTQGLSIGEGASNIHFDNGYVENISSPLIAGGGSGAPGTTFNGNHIANSGNITAVAQFLGGVTGGFRDNYEYGSGVTVAALAVCSGNGNSVDMTGSSSSVMTTTGCATSTASPSSSTLTVSGGSSVAVSANATPMTTISAPGVNPARRSRFMPRGRFRLLPAETSTLADSPPRSPSRQAIA